MKPFPFHCQRAKMPQAEFPPFHMEVIPNVKGKQRKLEPGAAACSGACVAWCREICVAKSVLS